MSDTVKRIDEPQDRMAAVNGLYPQSLVGSFFHSGHTRSWQGRVVAEPTPGTYLVETFSWWDGVGTSQRLITIQTMVGEEWEFYDTAEWMKFQHEHGGHAQRWNASRAKDGMPTVDCDYDDDDYEPGFIDGGTFIFGAEGDA